MRQLQRATTIAPSLLTSVHSNTVDDSNVAEVLIVRNLMPKPFQSKRPKIVLVGFLARCAKMADGGVYAAFGSASASATVFR